MKGYRYMSEDIEALVDQTDAVLSKPVTIYGEYIVTKLKYESVLSSLTSVSISYGDKVQTSHTSHDDRLVLLSELSLKCEELLKQYNAERQRLYDLLNKIDFTADEYYIMHYRYLIPDNPMSFEQIARKHGHMDRKRAFYLYTKAYIKASDYIENMRKETCV